MRYFYAFLVVWLFLGFFACSAIIEQDLMEEVPVKLQAPTNGFRGDQATHTFWWDDYEDQPIDGYRLEIVSPRFDSVETLVLREDILEGTTFEYTLSPGEYQWSVVAFNSTSETEPTIFNIDITGDSAMDLSNQILNLVSPNSDEVFANNEITFLWQLLSDANEYRIQIASPDFSNSTFIEEDLSLNSDNYTTTLTEGSYSWRVRGENDESVTLYSTRTFTIDQTPPAAPSLISPLEGDTITIPTDLSWQVDPNSSMDTLYIYSDSLLNNLILQVPTTNTSYLFNEDSEPKYFWRLRSVDQASNTSAYSETRSFYIE